MSVLGSEVEWEPSPTTQFPIFRNLMHYQSQPQTENVRSHKYDAFEELTNGFLLEQEKIYCNHTKFRLSALSLSQVEFIYALLMPLVANISYFITWQI